MSTEKSEAYGQCAEYLTKLMAFDQEDFEDEFQKHRDAVFVPAAEVLFAMNKKGFLNGFDLRYLSLPIEYSLQFNYWSYQVIKQHIKE